jgi:hypothetical protein
MKIIWQGTDSLFLVCFPKQLRYTKIFYVLALRLFAIFSDVFAQEHYTCGRLAEQNLKNFGFKKPIKQFADILQYPNKIIKVAHEGFNVLYYYPKKNTLFNKWLYSWDIYTRLVSCFSVFRDINFIIVDGCADMNKIYPITDLLIRPNRHDGRPRMVDECVLNNIPYVWTNQNPTVEYFKIEILKVYEKR